MTASIYTALFSRFPKTVAVFFVDCLRFSKEFLSSKDSRNPTREKKYKFDRICIMSWLVVIRSNLHKFVKIRNDLKKILQN